MNNNNSSIENKLSKIKYLTDNKSHIIIDNEKCKQCKDKICTFICPANVYKENTDGTITIEYENCLECTSCEIACPMKAIKWNHPKAEKGVFYKFS